MRHDDQDFLLQRLGIRARGDHFWPWLAHHQPHVVLLQEIKCQHETFPHDRAKQAGYDVHLVGQKGFNGVATLTKGSAEVVLDHLPEDGQEGDGQDTQARYLEIAYQGLYMANLYLPNGNPITDPVKWPYKLAWMARLRNRMADLLATETPALFGGDYNVCPTSKDIWDETANAEEAHVQPETRAAWHAMINLGMTEVRGFMITAIHFGILRLGVSKRIRG